MENHHFSWVNQRFQRPFSSSFFVCLPEANSVKSRVVVKSPFNEQIKKRQIQPVTGAVASESHELVQIPEDVHRKI